MIEEPFKVTLRYIWKQDWWSAIATNSEFPPRQHIFNEQKLKLELRKRKKVDSWKQIHQFLWNTISKRRGQQKGASFSNRNHFSFFDNREQYRPWHLKIGKATEGVHGRFFASSKYLGHIKSASPLT